MSLMDAEKVESGSRDATNSLPDEILAKILSFLPTKRAASTSLLSKRWRTLFPLMLHLFASKHHLYLDDSDFLYPEAEEEGKRERRKDHLRQSFKLFVDKTLSGCNPIKKLSLKYQDGFICFALTDQWVRKALERGVVDLDLRLKTSLEGSLVDLSLPCSVFTNKTLVKLTLGIDPGDVLETYPKEVSLPVLKSLCLHGVSFIVQELYTVMLPGCPLLEELSLNYLFDRLRKYETFSISHQTLRRLTVNRKSLDLYCKMEYNTPSLVYFDYTGIAPWSCSTANFLDSLLEAKLNIQLRSRYAFHSELPTVIKWICNVKTLSLSSGTVEVMSSTCMTVPSFINLVKLSFESNTKPGWKVLPHLLKQSPMLETLALKGLKYCVRRKGVCIDRNEVIKVLEIYGFRGKSKEFKQLDCFLGQMQFLQVLKVELDAGVKKKLRLTNRLLDLRDRSYKFQIQLL